MAMYLGKERAVILSQKYTTEKFSLRKTPDFGGLSQSTLFRVKKIKGSTVVHENTLKHAYINSIKSTGRNLIPYPFYETNNNVTAGITFTDNGDGSITVNGTATAYASFIVFKGVVKAGTYYLSGCNNAGNNLIELYFATPDFKIYKVDYGNGVKIDLQNDETIMIVINLQPNAVANNLVFKPMFNYGSTALPFEPYKESVWQLPEILELGEWDELNPQTGEVNRYTKNIVFNGREAWGVGGASSGKYRIRLSGIELSTGSTTNTSVVSNIICNHYEAASNDNTYMLKKGVGTQGSNLYFYDPDFDTNDISLWKAHLAELYANGNPLTIAYEKVEPTVEKIEGCPLAYTAFKGGTERVIQGEVNNSQFGAIPTIETGQTVAMELIIGDENG